MWPVLRKYDQNHLARIALPIGGIGTGTISLGGRGDLRDWEVMNHPAKGFNPGGCFFAVNIQMPGGEPLTRALEGQIDQASFEGASGCSIPNHGLPRFRYCSFEAAYPLGQVLLSDPELPIDVRLQAYNPLVPADPDSSGIPCGVFRYILHNQTDQPLKVSVCGSLSNFTGFDPAKPTATNSNINQFRKGEFIQGIVMTPSDNANERRESFGSLALVTTAQEGVSYKTSWEDRGWGSALLFFWEDFQKDGILQEVQDQSRNKIPRSSLAVSFDLPPQETQSVTFIICWHFPNRYTWTPAPIEDAGNSPAYDKDWIGNYYTSQYKDAWDVAEKVGSRLQTLEDQTLDFVNVFCSSSLPEVVKEAALFNLSTLRSQTCFRTPDGKFFGWEGCNDQKGCCHGSCTHVWNYEQATAFLYGSLARTMRETEFGPAIREDGCMSFRVNLPLERGRDFSFAAADGQMGCLMKLYRDWQLSGDEKLLRDLWPNAKKALAFAWQPGGWDADQDGVMEGCQHNTMDIEYFGPNPEIETWYLGALRAAEEMAKYMGDLEFAEKCGQLFASGKEWTDNNLFNGEYYEHQIIPVVDGLQIPPSLLIGMGAKDLAHPDYQLGAGCLVDQLVGQYMAHICGLGYLLDPDHVIKTLKSILKYNRKESFQGHFNCWRSYVLNEEAAILTASYPKGRPENPFPYFSEAWTGLEYVAAVGLFYEGQIEEGKRCYQDTRDRYDGFKRNPFDEAECGHHYARAMASWAAVPALSRFQYSGVTKRMTFAAQAGNLFWSNGFAWGQCNIQDESDSYHIELIVKNGEIKLGCFKLEGIGEVKTEVITLSSQDKNKIEFTIKKPPS
jgi:non-lysosomal glucosylceramidase